MKSYILSHPKVFSFCVVITLRMKKGSKCGRAHCYRRNSEINTNLAIESFSNLLKHNHLRRNAAVTFEKLLETFDHLEDIKM
jgi:hypothetical protein